MLERQIVLNKLFVKVVTLSATVLFCFSACKPRKEESSLKDLNPGQMMNDNDNSLNQMKENRKVVVIYYANDTYAPSTDPAFENLTDLMDALKKAAAKETDENVKKYLIGTADRLRNDWRDFGQTVGNDVGVLTEKLCSKVGSSYFDSVGGLAIFRNFSNEENRSGTMSSGSDLIRNLRWDSCRPGDVFLQGKLLEVPKFNEFPYDSQPFSHPLAFQKALAAVRTVFPPEKHRYILITKSHGSKENALVPHLSVDLRERLRTNADEVIDAIKSANKTGASGLDPFKTDAMLNGVDELLKKKIPDSVEKGISKTVYLHTINELGAGGPSNAMIFPIVFMESCKSELKLSKDSDIDWVLKYYPGGSYKGFNMQNVGLLYTSDEKGLRYDEINFFELSGWRYNSFDDFQDVIKNFLDSKAKK